MFQNIDVYKNMTFLKIDQHLNGFYHVYKVNNLEEFKCFAEFLKRRKRIQKINYKPTMHFERENFN